MASPTQCCHFTMSGSSSEAGSGSLLRHFAFSYLWKTIVTPTAIIKSAGWKAKSFQWSSWITMALKSPVWEPQMHLVRWGSNCILCTVCLAAVWCVYSTSGFNLCLLWSWTLGWKGAQARGGALGQVSYGGVQLRGNPYPILEKAGLRKHTLF